MCKYTAFIFLLCNCRAFSLFYPKFFTTKKRFQPPAQKNTHASIGLFMHIVHILQHAKL